MSNGSERIVPKTTAATSFSIEDQGKTERARETNCWQRIRSAFCHFFENITDCFDFWICKNECWDFCCTCDDDNDVDDENERNGVAPALIRSEQNWEGFPAKGIDNEALGTDDEENSSIEIHQGDCGNGAHIDGNHLQVLLEKQSGDHQTNGGQDNGACPNGSGGDAENQPNGQESRQSCDQQLSEGQNNDRTECFTAGGGDEENQTGGHKESQSGDQQFSGGRHNEHRVCFIGGDDADNQTAGHNDTANHHIGSYGQQVSEGHHRGHGVRELAGGSDSGGHNTNHGAIHSGNHPSGHHTSGGDHTNHGTSYSGSDSAGHLNSENDYGGGGGDVSFDN